MTKEDIIRTAREAGINVEQGFLLRFAGVEDDLERFAALVIANHPPQSFMTWQEGYEAGKQAEREACARVLDEMADDMVREMEPSTAIAYVRSKAAAIRARGQA